MFSIWEFYPNQEPYLTYFISYRIYNYSGKVKVGDDN